jgi:2-oxo-4-hydroxy-4-carboxy-5-ureidoimidazoline decarboxylase
MPERIGLPALNRLPAEAFVAKLSGVFEHAPWIAAGAEGKRPFASVTALHAAMLDELHARPEEEVLAFLRGHPSLSPRSMRSPGLAPDSMAEQTSAGIADLDSESVQRLETMNAAYEARFGRPFIIAARNASIATILGALERRLDVSPEDELAETLKEIAAITWMRLVGLVEPADIGGLTLVVSGVDGTPASSLRGVLRREGVEVCALETNERGVFVAEALRAGHHELRLDTSAYFAGAGYPTIERTELPIIGIFFRIWNPEEPLRLKIELGPTAYTCRWVRPEGRL